MVCELNFDPLSIYKPSPPIQDKSELKTSHFELKAEFLSSFATVGDKALLFTDEYCFILFVNFLCLPKAMVLYEGGFSGSIVFHALSLVNLSSFACDIDSTTCI